MISQPSQIFQNFNRQNHDTLVHSALQCDFRRVYDMRYKMTKKEIERRERSI